MNNRKSTIVLAAILGLLCAIQSNANAAVLLADYPANFPTTRSFGNVAAFGINIELALTYLDELGNPSGPELASTHVDFFTGASGTQTTDPAGLAHLLARITDATDDSLRIQTRFFDDDQNLLFTQNTGFLESEWIAGGDTPGAGASLSGFLLEDLTLSMSGFALRQQGTTALVTGDGRAQLYGTAVSTVPLAPAFWLFGAGLLALGRKPFRAVPAKAGIR